MAGIFLYGINKLAERHNQARSHAQCPKNEVVTVFYSRIVSVEFYFLRGVLYEKQTEVL